MSTSPTSTYSGPGAYGQQAAARFKAVPPQDRHATSIQYTPDFTKAGASDDLFAYAKSFDKDKNGQYSADEIQEATGLELSGLSAKEKIANMWDLDHNGTVDTKEMFTGLAHLDFADGKADGLITEPGRQHVEDTYLKSPLTSGGKIPPYRPGQLGATPEETADALQALNATEPTEENALKVMHTLSQYGPKPTATFNDPTKILDAHDANDPRLAGFSPSFWDNQRTLKSLAGQNVNDTFQRQNQDFTAQQEQAATTRYQGQLQDIATAVNLNDKFQKFMDKSNAST